MVRRGLDQTGPFRGRQQVEAVLAGGAHRVAAACGPARRAAARPCPPWDGHNPVGEQALQSLRQRQHRRQPRRRPPLVTRQRLRQLQQRQWVARRLRDHPPPDRGASPACDRGRSPWPTRRRPDPERIAAGRGLGQAGGAGPERRPRKATRLPARRRLTKPSTAALARSTHGRSSTTSNSGRSADTARTSNSTALHTSVRLGAGPALKPAPSAERPDARDPAPRTSRGGRTAAGAAGVADVGLELHARRRSTPSALASASAAIRSSTARLCPPGSPSSTRPPPATSPRGERAPPPDLGHGRRAPRAPAPSSAPESSSTTTLAEHTDATAAVPNQSFD